jgi:hypothetical protein
MMNRALASLGALLLTAAAPSAFPPLALVTPFGTPGRPAAPAANGPITGFVPAPVPDPDVYAPLSQQAGGGGLRPSLTVPSTGPTTQGNGFTRGSAYSGEQVHHFAPAPTLNLDLPLR